MFGHVETPAHWATHLLAVRDLASKDFIRAELRALLEELDKDRDKDKYKSE